MFQIRLIQLFSRLSFVFVVVVSFLFAGKVHCAPNAKYIILMISDGQGAKAIEATNVYTDKTPSFQVYPEWNQIWVSTYPYGGGYDTTQAWTNFNYIKNGWTDSAAASTALYTGVKTSNYRVAVTYDAGERLFSIGEVAKSQGMGVGAVTTASISDATPGGWTSHNDERANGYAIADEALFGDPNTTGLPMDTLYGGGYGLNHPPIDVLIGGRSVDYISSAIRDKLKSESGQPGKHTLVEQQAGQDGGTNLLDAANNSDTTKIVGLFDHVYHNADGSGFNPENPTLADRTNAALIVLNRNPNGFILLVEGAAVDWGAHANNMNQMIGEQIDFYYACQAVIDWVEDPDNDSNWDNTLVIITADHETGYLTAGPGIFSNVPLENINDTTLSLEKTYNGSGGRRASWVDSNQDGFIDASETVYWAWNADTHVNALVPLSARGPGADLFDELISGYDTIRGSYIDNTDVFSVMKMALVNIDECPDDQNKTQPGVCGCNLPDEDSDGDGELDCLDMNDDNDCMLDGEEQGPNGNDTNYDGNNDGTADSLQSNVVSFYYYNSHHYATVESPAGTSISECIVVDIPSQVNTPAGVEFSYGFSKLSIDNIGVGIDIAVRLYIPDGLAFDTFYMYGRTPNLPTNNYYEYIYDGQTGVKIDENIIIFYFVDGQRGDDDLTANGVVKYGLAPVSVSTSAHVKTTVIHESGCLITTVVD